MQTLLKEATAIKKYTVDCRRRLHAFAECGFELPKTLLFVKNELQNLGYKPEICGKCGLVCELNAEKGLPLVFFARRYGRFAAEGRNRPSLPCRKR